MTTATTERIEYTDSFDARSSNLNEVFYNENSRNLYVTFLGGDTIYQYGSVPKDVFDAFARANSRGRFYVNEIKGRYPRGVQTDDYDLFNVGQPISAAEANDNPWSVSLTITGSTESFIDSVREVAELLDALTDNGYDYTLTGANLSS